jgi:RNA polymerase-binding transcription factor DksA
MDLERVRTDLVERRSEIVSEIERLTAPPEAGANVAFGKRIGDGTTEAVERIATTATARSLTASLADIDRALAKIDDGTYGRCDECDAAIASARLEARPASVRCVDHA